MGQYQCDNAGLPSPDLDSQVLFQNIAAFGNRSGEPHHIQMHDSRLLGVCNITKTCAHPGTQKSPPGIIAQITTIATLSRPLTFLSSDPQQLNSNINCSELATPRYIWLLYRVLA